VDEVYLNVIYNIAAGSRACGCLSAAK